MRITQNILTGSGAMLMLLMGTLITPLQVFAGVGDSGEMPGKKACAAAMKAGTNKALMGSCIASDRKGGNCQACHSYKGLENTRVQAGNVGPMLTNLKDRYSVAQVRALVFDKRQSNPNTMMPPFGANKILSEPEIDLVVEWLMTL